jgi:lon-related putative ATP-dependent protease
MASRRVNERLRVAPKRLRCDCSLRVLPFRTTDDLEPLAGTVGQDRAVRALDFGLNIEAEGFHVFVSGPPGTGRTTELRAQLERVARERSAPRDWCYAFNFSDPARPWALSLRPGRGHELSHEVDDFIQGLRSDIPRAFESDEYVQRRDQVGREVGARREEFFEALQHEATERGLAVNATPMGITSVPLLDGKPITKEQYDLLTDERKKEIQQKSAELESIIAQMAPQLRRLERGAQQLLKELDKQVIVAVASPRLDELKRDYAEEPDVVRFLDTLGTDIVEHIDDFRAPDEQAAAAVPLFGQAVPRDGVFNRYQVNVIVTHDPDGHAPIIVEENPSYYHLFGRIDYRASFGSMVTDHTMIKPGALHRANGGFLVVQALDILTAPLVWDTLKRALRTRQVRLENMGEQFSVIPTSTLAPESIPLDVKVAMIGTPRIFAILQAADEDFAKLFKAKADFTTEVERSDEHSMLYARFIAGRVRALGMRPFEKAAVARIVEQSSRMVADQEKLSLRMTDVVDLLVEADYWACDAGRKVVEARDVERAIDDKVYRSNLIEERVQEFITRGTIKVDTTGTTVGQVNGLSVFDIGDYAFGRPSRITARVSMGRGQVINIEREVQRSGAAHSKGFLILQGFLNGQFAHRRPLSFAATIAFEQVYDEVDGDSASSTELYALLSAITDVPLRQGIAVTGSVNQHGQVQAIGGVNEKIEGFYAVCKTKGLTGGQGVMIPRDNLRNLMLKPEVVKAVADQRFHVWAVTTIDEGIELLTGMPAGKPKKDGTYPEGTLYRKVTDMLEELTRRAMEVNRGAREPLAPTSASPNGSRAGPGEPPRPAPKPGRRPTRRGGSR